MFLKIGISILLANVVSRLSSAECQGSAPPFTLMSGSYRQLLRSFVPVPEGRSTKLSDIKIVYYRDSTKNSTSYRIRHIESVLKDKNFDLEKPTVLYIHGYVELVTDNSVQTVMTSYIKHGGYNILALDWANLAFGNYINVLFDIQPVGDEAGKAMVKLVKAGLKRSGLHIVGHSMGVHVGAVAARRLASKGFTVERLTGLDPAYPGFYPPLRTAPISPRDASFVDVIHTAAGEFGSPVSGGHADFWPNGGAPVQPGCPPAFVPLSDEDFCSHWRSWHFWAESVLGGNFLAAKCDNYNAFLKGNCSGSGRMGLQASPDLRGNFYLKTASQEPFALGEKGIC